jgi:hypothetical protein
MKVLFLLSSVTSSKIMYIQLVVSSYGTCSSISTQSSIKNCHSFMSTFVYTVVMIIGSDKVLNLYALRF